VNAQPCSTWPKTLATPLTDITEKKIYRMKMKSCVAESYALCTLHCQYLQQHGIASISGAVLAGEGILDRVGLWVGVLDGTAGHMPIILTRPPNFLRLDLMKGITGDNPMETSHEDYP